MQFPYTDYMTRIRCLFALLLTLFAVSLYAEKETDLLFSAAGEVWTTPETSGQGIGIFGLNIYGFPHGASLRLLLNTETLQIDYGNIRFDWFEMGFQVKGEAFFAGLLPNYFYEGIKDPENGFNASYIQGESHFVIRFLDILNLALSLQGKQWFFSPNNATGETFVLPANRFVFTPQLLLTFWAFKNDPSLLMPHYYFYRIKGIGMGIAAGSNLSTNTDQWGPTDSSGNFLDERNRPREVSFFIRQWLRAGVPLDGPVRIQLTQRAGYGYGEDDLTRDRIGGMNPYVVPVHGLPWASILGETYVGGELSLHAGIFKDSELVFLVDAAGVKDLERTSSENWGAVIGSAIGLDFRFGDWFLNARFGYSFVPSFWEQQHFTGLFIGFGSTF